MKATRFLLFILACVLSIGTGWAGSGHTFYYKVTSATGGHGKVYASLESVDNPSYGNGNTTAETSVYDAGETASGMVYLYAKPDANYKLDHWVGSDGQTLYGENTHANITLDQYAYWVPIVGTQHNTKTYTYTAIFKSMGVLRVDAKYIDATQDEPGGRAEIDPVDNEVNDPVTLTAFNRYDYNFIGWYNGTTPLNQNQIWSTTVHSASPTTYTAKFEKSTVTYYRIYKKSSNGNRQYLKVTGNQASAISNGKTNTDVVLYGMSMNGCLATTTSYIGDPGTIFKIGHGNYDAGVYKELSLEAQGVYVQDAITTAFNSFKSTLDNSVQGQMPDISGNLVLSWNSKDGYEIRHQVNNYYLETGSDGKVYFAPKAYDHNSTTLNNDTWYIEPVDGSTNTANLAVTADKTIGDKYYTTLFVSFPFTCAEGMKAYYVTDIVDNIAQCNTNGITKVDAFTPVILEWTAGNGYVVPINTGNTQTVDITSNAMDEGSWKGCINLYTTGGSSPNLHTCYFDREDGTMTDANSLVTFNPSTMRVLDVEGNDLVLKASLANGTNMPSNKAYIEKDSAKDLYVVIFPLELDEVNTEIDNLNAIYAEVSVKRTIAGPKEGETWSTWNTLCLPFDLDAEKIEAQFGECELKALDYFWVSEDGTLHLRYKKAETIKCGQPYIIRVKKDITDLALKNIRVNTEATNMQHFETEDYNLDFKGSYVYLNGTNSTGDKYVPYDSFIINKDLYYHVNSNVKMKGFRAYFLATAKNLSKSPIKTMKLSDDEPTNISNINFEGLEDGPIYNLQGVRQNAMQHGVNIVNGKKIIR